MKKEFTEDGVFEMGFKGVGVPLETRRKNMLPVEGMGHRRVRSVEGMVSGWASMGR